VVVEKQALQNLSKVEVVALSRELEKRRQKLQLEETQDDLGDLLSYEMLDAFDQTQSPYCCGRCKHAITEEGWQITILGRHNHRFMNPVGVVYNVGCFEEAPGVVTAGSPEARWTWFPGFEWQVVRCSECQLHLGWLYTRESSAFFGLIIDRLHKGDPEEPPPGDPEGSDPGDGIPI
jgi:hypothetical protein